MLGVENEEREEKLHWKKVISTLVSYKKYVIKEMRRRQSHLNRVPEKHLKYLPERTFEQLWKIDQAADSNQLFFEDVAYFQQSHMFPDENKDVDSIDITVSDQHRNTAIIHSIFREWSQEGKEERDQSFQPLLSALQHHLPVNEHNAYTYKVLVPGSGLGRLPLEVASLGYCCQGNEYSAFMAAPSNYILNEIDRARSYTIRPWLDRVCNVQHYDDVLQEIHIPDRTATEMLHSCPYWKLPPPNTNTSINHDNNTTENTSNSSTISIPVISSFPRFSMGIGDFVSLYSSPEERDIWNAVLTCFFIDTAPVVMEYIETIAHVLSSGGIWVNIGPLLYHWIEDVDNNQDERYQKSIELSWEEIKYVIEGYGFEFLSMEWKEVTYARCPSSMMHTMYKWLINIQLSILSCLFELLACLTQNTETIDKFGFFNGYTQYTLAVCVLQASVGIMVALVVKYADNIHKGFASSISVIISELIELHIFHDVSINHSFLTGSFLIIMSTVAFGIYNNRHKSTTTNATTTTTTTTNNSINITSMLPQYMSTPHYRVRSSSSSSTTSDYTLTSYSGEPSYIPLSKAYPLSQLSADSQVQGGTSYNLHQIHENDDSTTTDIHIPIQNTLSHNDPLEYEYSTTSQSVSDHGLLSDNNRRMTSRSTDIYINTDQNKSKSTAIS